MTQQDINTIVDLVIAALQTSGKTIAQLTAVDNVGNSDCFELSGGRKVSYGTLAGLLVEQIGNIESFTVVDYDGRDEITSFAYTASTGTLTIKQDGRDPIEVTIKSATTSRPGLMTATDKSNLATAVDKVVTALSQVTNATSLTLTLTTADSNPLSVSLPVATTTKAGLMSALDKSNLNSAKATADSIAAQIGEPGGIAQLDANGKLVDEQFPAVLDNKADQLEDAEILHPDEWPRYVLANLPGEDDGDATVGNLIFVRRQQGSVNIQRLDLLLSDNTTATIGAPMPNVVYVHKTTGLSFMWDENDGVFYRVGIEPQVMKSMGSVLDNVGNTSPISITYVPAVGDFYFDSSDGKIKYKKSENETLDLGAPNKLLIYTNTKTNLMYRWSGTAMVQVGGSGSGGASVEVTDTEVIIS